MLSKESENWNDNGDFEEDLNTLYADQNGLLKPYQYLISAHNVIAVFKACKDLKERRIVRKHLACFKIVWSLNLTLQEEQNG